MRPRRRPLSARIIPLLGLIFLILLVGGSPLFLTSRSGFCGTCHIMKPYYRSWKTSTHARVRCVKCHTEPGFQGYVTAKARLAWQVLINFTIRPKKVRSSANVGDQICLLCHNVKRKVTLNNDVKMPPRHHLTTKRGLECLSCHKNLVHSNSSKGRNRPSMSVCTGCHKKRGVSNECSVCHTAKKSTDNF